MANGRGIHTPTLCWDCQKANAFGCSWFNGSWKPVEGWNAERSLHVDKLTGKIFDSYFVKSCPLFEKDEEVEIPDEPYGIAEETKKRMKRMKRLFYVYKKKPKEAPIFTEELSDNGTDVLIGTAEAAHEIERIRTKEKKLSFDRIVGRLEYATATHVGPVTVCGTIVYFARYLNGRIVPAETGVKPNRNRAKRVKCVTTGKTFKSFLEAGRWLETQQSETIAKSASSYFSYARGRFGKQPFEWRGYTWKLLD